jgi:peptide/nickel transport system permease protein
MTAYLVRRLLATIPVMMVVAVVVFSLIHIAPGDPAAIIAGDNVTPKQIAEIRARLGLDEPLWKQFKLWITNLAQGDLGTSIFSRKPVTELIAQRAEPTIALTTTTLIVAISIAITAGVLAAWKVGTWVDRGVMIFAVMGFSVPVFVVGYGLVYVFSMQLKWLPVQGYAPIADGVLPFIRHLILPSIALGLAYVALIARITRTSMLEVLSEDYIRTADAKGVATRPKLIRHALKNAAVPIATVIGIGVALLIGGVVITESVFNIPGIGRLTVDAILKRDYPIIQGIILVFSGIYVLINLAVDMLYTVLDPRIRYLPWRPRPRSSRSRRPSWGTGRDAGPPSSSGAIRPSSPAARSSPSWPRSPPSPPGSRATRSSSIRSTGCGRRRPSSGSALTISAATYTRARCTGLGSRWSSACWSPP